MSETLTPDDMWVTYQTNIINAATASIPLAIKRPWTPRNSARVRSAIRKHRRLCSPLANDLSLSSRLQLKSSLDALKRVIYNECCKHEHFLTSGMYSNSKPFWSYVKSKIKSSFRISVIEDCRGKDITSPNQIAECFSNHFAGVF